MDEKEGSSNTDNKKKLKKKKGAAVLSVVPPNSSDGGNIPPNVPPGFDDIGIDPQALQNLDLDVLRDNMMRGIYTLEAALFTQSGFEYKRVTSLRRVISEFETTLFDPKVIESLSPRDKIKLYGLMLNNMHNSLGFLQNLHGEVTSGIEALSHIEKLKSQKSQPSSVTTPSDVNKINQVKALIMSKIKEKTKL